MGIVAMSCRYRRSSPLLDITAHPPSTLRSLLTRKPVVILLATRLATARGNDSNPPRSGYWK